MADSSGYPDIQRGESYRPVASPVSTFVPVQEQRVIGPNRLSELADTLKPISAELRAWAHTRDVKREQEDKLRGQQAFIANNAKGYAQAVEEGLIPAQSSPVFVAGYKRAQGDLAGNRLTTKFQSAYLAWDQKDSADEAAFDGFVNDFLKENVTTTDPDILRGLMPHVDALHSGANSLFTKDRSDTFYKGALDTFAARGSQAIDGALVLGLGSATGTDYAALHQTLMDNRTEAHSLGIRTADWDKSFIDLVATKAIEHRDPSLLALLDNKVPGTQMDYADLPHGRDVKLATETRLESIVTAEEGRLHTRDERVRQAAVRKSTDDIVQHLFSNPMEPIPEAILNEARKWDPSLPIKALEWQNKVLASPVQESDAAIAQVQKDVLAGGGTAAVMKAVDAGIIKNAATMRTMYDWAKGRDKESGTHPILQGSVVEGFRKTIRERTAPDALLQAPWDTGGTSNEGLRLLADLEIDLLAWDQAHPNADPIEKRKAQAEIGSLVLQGIDGGKGPGAKVEVNRAPLSETLHPENLPMAGPSNISQEAREFAAFTDAFTDEDRKNIKAQAVKRGLTEQEFTRRMFITSRLGPIDPATVGRKPEAPQATPEATPAPAPEPAAPEAPQAPEQQGSLNPVYEQPLPGPDAGKDLQAGLPNEPAANSLLDFIARNEGPGGYNHLYGEAAPQTNLTAERIGDLLKRTGNTAAGRYQIIAPTLKGLVERLGVGEDQQYTPAIQDKMALSLLEDRGLREFLDGKMSITAFANSLAQEWDSLPIVSGKARGKRWHDKEKDAPVSVEDFLSLLRGLRDKSA